MSTVHTETKEDSTTQQNHNIPKKTKKKKKKKPILYQETAVKYYHGFMKNKRYNKGINLSTGCAIFKIAWELPENNGLILPSRVMRHFKQVLPKKPKQKNKKKKLKKNTNQETKTDEFEPPETDLIRSRTMMEIAGINTLNLNPPTSNNLIPITTQPLRRTMIVTTTHKNKSLLPVKESIFDDKIEDAIDNNLLNKHSPITLHKHILSKSMDNISYNLNTPVLATSDTPVTPDISDIIAPDTYSDHADIRMEDMKPDVEETPMLVIRAETDIKHMHDDVISFKIDLMEEKKEFEFKQKTVKKKKKKKAPILYAEDATKLFKKINDGKRLKNGITLKKACNIFAVAWELPEENGRILPSKVARHFKQVLPSKKNKKKTKKSKSVNIKPSVAKSKNLLIKPQTMRGHAKPNWTSREGHHIIRSVYEIPLSSINNEAEAGGNCLSNLETLLASDPHRSNSNDNEKHVTRFKRKKAGSLTDLDLDIDKINDFEDDMDHMEEDQIVENEIEQLIREKKKLKEKELDVINAIDASLGF